MREEGYYWVKEYYRAKMEYNGSGIMSVFFAVQCEQAIDNVYKINESRILDPDEPV